MFKLIALFALLGFAFAAPKPDPVVPLIYRAGTPLTYTYDSPLGSPLTYSSPIAYSSSLGNLQYQYAPYAANYYGNYAGGLPLAYRNLYI